MEWCLEFFLSKNYLIIRLANLKILFTLFFFLRFERERERERNHLEFVIEQFFNRYYSIEIFFGINFVILIVFDKWLCFESTLGRLRRAQLFAPKGATLPIACRPSLARISRQTRRRFFWN